MLYIDDNGAVERYLSMKFNTMQFIHYLQTFRQYGLFFKKSFAHLFFDVAPKAETVVDFWRMVMDHKPSAVVMLTNLVETGKVSLIIISFYNVRFVFF